VVSWIHSEMKVGGMNCMLEKLGVGVRIFDEYVLLKGTDDS
jgi:hypothetical protein